MNNLAFHLFGVIFFLLLFCSLRLHFRFSRVHYSFFYRDMYIGYTDDPCMHHHHRSANGNSKVLASSSDVVITTENKIYSRIFLDFFHGLTLAPSRWSSIIFRRILLVSVFISLSLDEVVICFFVVIRHSNTHTHT